MSLGFRAGSESKESAQAVYFHVLILGRKHILPGGAGKLTHLYDRVIASFQKAPGLFWKWLRSKSTFNVSYEFPVWQ